MKGENNALLFQHPATDLDVYTGKYAFLVVTLSASELLFVFLSNNSYVPLLSFLLHHPVHLSLHKI
jgi:hypothetical protein